MSSHDYHWVDQADKLYGDVLNSDKSWCNSLWQKGKPDFEWQNIPNCVLVMFYSGKEGRWCWYDDRADSVISGRQYAYIIEYD